MTNTSFRRRLIMCFMLLLFCLPLSSFRIPASAGGISTGHIVTAHGSTTQVSTEAKQGALSASRISRTLTSPAWHIVPSPSPGTYLNGLFSVAAISTNDVWAVGDYDNGNGIHETLTEHWNGSNWSVIVSPSPGSLANVLTSVAAVSSNNVWAVGNYGNYYNGYGIQTLIEHWNGHFWSWIPSLNPGIFNNLTSVAAISEKDIWAVGNYGDYYNGFRTLIEHWNGHFWSGVASPNPGRVNNILLGVSAAAAKDIWAVGASSDSYGGGNQSMAMHWNGSTWNLVSSPNADPGVYVNGLQAVVAVSSSDVWAVGSYDNNNGKVRTLIEQWNGQYWSVVSSPSPGKFDNVLNGVAVIPKTTTVLAVGNYYKKGYQTLIEEWNGTQWIAMPSPKPNPGTISNTLLGVAAISTSDIWAVGSIVNRYQIQQTLTEHYA